MTYPSQCVFTNVGILFITLHIFPTTIFGVPVLRHRRVGVKTSVAPVEKDGRQSPKNTKHNDPIGHKAAADALCHCIRNAGNSPSLVGDPEAALELLLQDMHRNMRTFVYPADTYCPKQKSSHGAYLLEYVIYNRMQVSKLKIDDPDAANVFYLPTFTNCWRGQRKDRNDGGKYAAAQTLKLVEQISEALPYFTKLHGRQHFWVSAHDMGKAEAAALAPLALIVNASALVNNADSHDLHNTWGEDYGFNPSRDVSTPCNGLQKRAEVGLKNVQDPSQLRPYLAFFAGELKSIRSEAGKSFDETYTMVDDGTYALVNTIIGSFFKVPSSKPNKIKWGHLAENDYLDSLEKSDFCLAPRGSRVFSPRLFEAIWFGCIPVIIADNYYLPGSCVWEWSNMSVRIAEKEANQTASILAALTPEWIAMARKTLLRIRERFMWHHVDVKGDAFELTMLDVFVKQKLSACGA